ncbi:30S ribosomal protein S8 [Candidatus Woesearchaeota archaeon]|nr:30S ribosomal protein S8 [Candidatus Woesearchaeota archaeon]
MALNDTLSNTLSHILNCEKVGKQECIIKPSSNLIKNVLEIMKRYHYVEKTEYVENNKGGILKLKLTGKINKCGAIKPRFSVTKNEIEKFEKRYLPAKNFGVIIISTPNGLTTHYEAKEKNLGGRLIAYVY